MFYILLDNFPKSYFRFHGKTVAGLEFTGYPLTSGTSKNSEIPVNLNKITYNGLIYKIKKVA